MPITAAMWRDPLMRERLLAGARKGKATQRENSRKYVYLLKFLLVDEQTGCWNWIGSRDKLGYARMIYDGKQESVHRVSAHVFLRFDLNSDLHVLHRCDNPPCFNPKHLFIGTHLDNMKDKSAKGRHNNQKKKSCPQGHVYDSMNTCVKPSEGRRRCRICMREQRRNYRRKLREKKECL
jgi:HNH endonuclease